MKNSSNSQNKIDIKHSINFLTCGDSTVGKTSIILRYTKNSFPKKAMSTIGVDFRSKTISLDDHQYVQMIIWDTAGQERFRNVASNYYNKSDCILLIFDITNQDSFRSIKDWVKAIEEKKDLNDIMLVLVGNKMDLEESRKVSIDEINQFKTELKIGKYYEVSALSGEGVQEMFVESLKDTIELVKKRDKNKNKENKEKMNTNMLSLDKAKKHCCEL